MAVSPDQTGWNALLGALSDDTEDASLQLKNLLIRLERIFMCRGCSEPQDAAHEVIYRVANRLAGGAVLTTDVGSYASGFIGPVFHEWLRGRSKAPIDGLESLDKMNLAGSTPETDEWLDYLHACLDSSLKSHERDLLLQFHAYDGRRRVEVRRELARAGKKSSNALRIEAHRLRKRLQSCIEALMAAPQ